MIQDTGCMIRLRLPPSPRLRGTSRRDKSSDEKASGDQTHAMTKIMKPLSSVAEGGAIFFAGRGTIV